jgi:flagella basal body P-ring formation protein FlgA
MKKWMRSIIGWGGFGALAGAALAGRAMADVSVTLRANASVSVGTVAAGGGITVADVADIDPPTTEEAESIAEIVVIPAGTGTTCTVSIAQVRAAMDAAKVHWGKTTLRGSHCVVTMSGGGGEGGSPSTRPMGTGWSPKLGLAQTTPQMVDVGDGNGPETIRQAVSVRLVDLYNVEAADLRLAFDAADEDFLSQTIWKAGVQRRVDVQPAGTGGSVRTPVSIVIYEGDQIAATRMIAVQALINRTVVMARAPIVRGQMIGSDLVETGRQWMGPNARPPVGPEAAIGQIAARSIAAGAVLSTADVTAPVVCKRGDIVWVHALSGPMTVKAKCRAQAQARDGELVQLKMDGSDRMFTARMSGPGRAVMVTSDPPSQGAADAKAAKAATARSGGTEPGEGERPVSEGRSRD